MNHLDRVMTSHLAQRNADDADNSYQGGCGYERVVCHLRRPRPGMRCDGVLSAALAHRQRVANHDPAAGVFHDVTSVLVPGS